MFHNIDEVKEFVECECMHVQYQHEDCFQCGGSLIDNCGSEEYFYSEEIENGAKFCSECCLEQFIVENIGISNYDQ